MNNINKSRNLIAPLYIYVKFNNEKENFLVLKNLKYIRYQLQIYLY